MISDVKLSPQLSTILDIITASSWEKISPNKLSWHLLKEEQLFILSGLEYFSEKLELFTERVLKNNKSILIIPGNELGKNITLQNWLGKKKIFFEHIVTEPSKIDFVNKLHPICSIFTENLFNLIHINKIWKIKAPGFTPLLSTSKDFPLLLIKDKLMLTAIDFNENWSNIGFQTVFPVLIYNIGNFLGKERSQLNSFEVGTPFSIPEKGILECKIPDGKEIPLLTEETGEEFTNTNQQGQYFLLQKGNLVQVFSFNVSREESDLSILSESQIEILQKKNPKLHFLKDNWRKNILTSRYGYELWKIILWIVLALLVIEMIIAYSGKKILK